MYKKILKFLTFKVYIGERIKMNKIKVIQLNNSTTDESARMACFGARLSQHAFELMSGSRSLDDFFKPESDIKFASKLAELPHYTLNRMTKINVLITGLSIRASRQLTRHQTDVVFMSASLQYEKILYSINASADEFFLCAKYYYRRFA